MRYCMQEPIFCKRRGGKREGAGRPKGSGRFQTETKSIRVPLPLLPQVEEMFTAYLAAKKQKQILLPDETKNTEESPLFLERVRAGWLSSASDTIEEKLNLHSYIVRHPNATFFVKVQGDSMNGAGIQEGDIVAVDRAIPPKHGSIVIAAVNGEMTIKRLFIEKKRVTLLAENPTYPPLPIQEEQDLRIWGVVTFVIHKV